MKFEHVPDWEKLPEGWSHLDVDGVTVDGQDRVYILTRSEPRVIVYERDGSFVTAHGARARSPSARTG